MGYPNTDTDTVSQSLFGETPRNDVIHMSETEVSQIKGQPLQGW
jgi:hypothetical protein